jgi:hypothetical protein
MNSTGNFTPDYIRHTYKVTNELKSYTVYELTTSEGNTKLLTDILRIEQFQGKSQTTRVDDYLRLRTDPKSWTRSQLITGLRPTSHKFLFSGDSKSISKYPTKKTLLMFLFSTDRQTLFIDVYRGFYPIHNGILENIINNYKTT